MNKGIPKDWFEATIGEVAQISTGNKDTKDKIFGGKYPFFVRSQSVERINSYSFDGEAILTAGDGVGTGKVFHYINGKFDFHQRVYKLSNFSMRVSPRFLYEYFCQNFIYQVNKFSAKGSVDSVRMKMIAGMKIPLPPLPEQQKVAAILTSVNEVIDKTESQISKLQDLMKGMMQELLTTGIGHTEFKDSPVGRIPSDWQVVPLEEVAKIQTGVAKSKNTSGDLVEVPYLRVANVQDGFLDLSEIKTIMIPKNRVARYLLQPEDVLVNEGGDFDKLGRGNLWEGQIPTCIHQNHVFVVRTKRSVLIPRFFNLLSGSDYGKKYYLGCAKQTTNLASINSSQLKKFPVLIPPIAEQKKLVSELESVDGKLRRCQMRQVRIGAMKKALMQDLLTGKVRVKVN